MLGVLFAAISACVLTSVLSQSKSQLESPDGSASKRPIDPIDIVPEVTEPAPDTSISGQPHSLLPSAAAELLSRADQPATEPLVREAVASGDLVELRSTYVALAARPGAASVNLREVILSELSNLLSPAEAEEIIFELAGHEDPEATGDEAIRVARLAGNLIGNLCAVMDLESDPVPHLAELSARASSTGQLAVLLLPLAVRGAIDVTNRPILEAELVDLYHRAAHPLVRQQVLPDLARWGDTSGTRELLLDAARMFEVGAAAESEVATAVMAMRILADREPENRQGLVDDMIRFAGSQHVSEDVFVNVLAGVHALDPGRLEDLRSTPFALRDARAREWLDTAISGGFVYDPMNPRTGRRPR